MQLINKARFRQRNHTWARQLLKCPHARGRIIKFFVTSPKKPNSARRKTAKIILSNKKLIFAKLIGEGYLPQKYALVLIRGGGYKDTPQVNYTMLRGVLECLPLFYKKRRRSHFGLKKSMQIVKNESIRKYVIHIYKLSIYLIFKCCVRDG